ncbi:carbamoyltransferase HypF [Tengunoibacter tsumagoiensis]|uniref:Carbamoyltransferase n=1 Tax=Tengunoibacter tsumagoiensis TaxID=2014871 RepID=A0A402A0Z6_9CHLR|nr:carbamoyltransferase HypF [Tengunoibacter tsumagoiensis]GCE12793.1 carbamoyltransferase [Tengunoibacter tsumagoiensis]
MSSVRDPAIQRQRIIVEGIVQGVGFRPFVYSRALFWKLAGFVFNDSRGVTIEIEGSATAIAGFQQDLQTKLPPLASIISLQAERIPLCHEDTFTIKESQTYSSRQALISPDTATCDECIHELFDPANRRYHYPFINCTNCGPRFTIIQDVPYDRDKTTMRVFPQCAPCSAEYSNPLDRRFHAQPNACPVCGPHLQLLDWVDPFLVEQEQNDSIAIVAQCLAKGAIFAIKGLGGYHLACDALNPEVVQSLRARKHREAKPFALMVPDVETAQQLCLVSHAERELLKSRRRPIVLLAKRVDCLLAPAVAPTHKTLGIMLPYTPLHHLLLAAFAQLNGSERPSVLVMTSGNLSDEPIVYRDEEVLDRLSSIAEGMLAHNRTIHMRCDDSVVRVVSDGEQIFRRSRGYAPEPITLASALPLPILACGGHLKNTFCLGKGKQAFLSHHIGDLENVETLTSFREGIEHFQRLFAITPQAIAYDLHPEYLATKYALSSAIEHKIPIQHHHAHIASVMAEHGLSEPVIGVAVDGTGYGSDGAIWGCEILRADLTTFQRLAHLAYQPLVGGEQAVRQPWRMAATYLASAYGENFLALDIPFVRQVSTQKWHILQQMITKNINCPPTSSLGRLFDAVAALLGVCSEVIYEGQAAIELEVLAQQARPDDQLYPISLHPGEADQPATLDVQPLYRRLVEEIEQHVPIEQIAYRFHNSIAHLLLQGCLLAQAETDLMRVALSGGVFQNRLLLERLTLLLQEQKFHVYRNHVVPPNDGGLSLGQLAIAAARLQTGEK